MYGTPIYGISSIYGTALVELRDAYIQSNTQLKRQNNSDPSVLYKMQ